MIITINDFGGGGSASSIKYEVVTELPSEGKVGVIYLIESEEPTEGDKFNEYIWLKDEGTYEKLGSMPKIDLDEYYTKEESDEKFSLNDKDFYVEVYRSGNELRWRIFRYQGGYNPTSYYRMGSYMYFYYPDGREGVRKQAQKATYYFFVELTDEEWKKYTRWRLSQDVYEQDNRKAIIVNGLMPNLGEYYADKEEVAELSAKVDDLQLYKFPNATIFGTPTINNGQVSNFSNDNYLQFPFLVDFQNREFEIKFSFTTPNDLSGQQNILDSNYGLAFAIRDGKVVAVASDNGTSWTTGELISNETLTPNTTYYFTIYWKDGIFGYKGGTSKEDESIAASVEMANTPFPKTMVIGRSYTNNGNHFGGSINLNDASLEISNKVVWQGMDDVGLATRAAVDLSNIDDKGKEVIKDIVSATFQYDEATKTLTIITE